MKVLNVLSVRTSEIQYVKYLIFSVMSSSTSKDEWLLKGMTDNLRKSRSRMEVQRVMTKIICPLLAEMRASLDEFLANFLSNEESASVECRLEIIKFFTSKEQQTQFLTRMLQNHPFPWPQIAMDFATSLS